jgi:3-oxoacyl-[acyl-carrier-protein] synthase II
MRDGERRVVVTGMGALTPVGNDVPSFWDSLVNGRSGITRITSFDPVRTPAKVAGEIKDWDAETVMPKKEIRRNDRYVHYAWAATVEAMADAGLPNPIEDEALAWRTGAIIGSGIGGINTMIRDIVEAHDLGVERIGPFLVTALIPDMAAGYVAIYANARGPNYSTISACSSSNHAIGDALTIIRRGDADVMIAGGAEAPLAPLCFGAFSIIRAMSTRNDDPAHASRPFDADRDGFVMAEGSAVLVLEERERALARGAPVYIEICGYGLTNDAYHMTAPRPDGSQAARCMRNALAEARVAPAEVGYINAHGSSTPLNDPTEVSSIKQVFGEHAYRLALSGTKGYYGHALGASGAFEAAICALASQRRWFPPTVNLERPDPACDLDHVTGEGRRLDPDYVLSNSFGFGGINAALVFRKADV